MRTRSSTRRARPGRRRASCSPTRNAMSVCEMVEELEFVQPDETTYLYLPLAHVFALITQLASYDQGTAIVYFGGDTKQILAEIIETQPTYLPSVPRIFEKLYAAATKMQEQASRRGPGALPPGGQARRRGAPAPRSAARRSPTELEQAFEQADEQHLLAGAGAVRRPRAPGGDAAPRRSRRRSWSSSTRRGCRCSRAGA